MTDTTDQALREALHADGAVPAESGDPSQALHFGDPLAEYRMLVDATGVVDFSQRTQLELTGDDRASFLHNMCTNEIRKLAAGNGCEAFLLDAHGRVLAHVLVFCRADSLVLEAVPRQAQRILAHLDRYLIREKVELHDRGPDWAELLIAGETSAEMLSHVMSHPPPTGLFEHVDAHVDGVSVQVRRVDLTLPCGFLVSCNSDDAAALWRFVRDAGATACGAQAVDMARIEAGTPWYGQDISEKNLPQELARDGRAISFVKGCYIGQETVARIDALGHVNRTLCGVRFAGTQVPPAGEELRNGGQVVGEVTSAAWSPRLGAPLALAFLRRGGGAPDTKLESRLGEAEVVTLPAV
jgi:tRNA-modifying protein YgfZ